MTATKPKILLVYTGGTIGMEKHPETGALQALDFKTLLEKIPELQLLACAIDTVSLETPIDSGDMHPSYWIQIAECIETAYNKFDGFVVLHGSDTMSYTASALSFMLENLSKPVIFTGSQLPIGDLRTDAKENLITSIQVASLRNKNNPVVREVCLYFEYKLYRANRTSKVNTEHFKAFTSPNYPYLAVSGVHLNINTEHLLASNASAPLVVNKTLDHNIGIITLFPGISMTLVKTILETPGIKGVILETYGAGNATTQDWFIHLLARAIKKGLYIVNVTQCTAGSVMMGQYQTSTLLKAIGVISGRDITIESAVSKLMYLLGQHISRDQFKVLYETPLRGEMT